MLAALALLSGWSVAGASEQRPAKLPLERSEQVDGHLSLTVVDLAPRFLDFHAAARDADADTRWRLWQERYGFAAVPPTDEGMAMARSMLDAAWDDYPAALPVIEAGASAMQPAPMPVLREVAALLGLDRPFAMQVFAYVGAFDGNAFTAAQDGVPLVAIPLEMDRDLRERVFRHEMTHAVHIATAGLSGGWERSIAETVIQEGLAMHAVRVLLPGREDREYIEHSAGWYQTAMARAPAILRGIEPALDAADGETVFRYTMGSGTTGIEREAYLTGWLVVGRLLEQGRSFAEIARIPAAEMPALVRSTIVTLLPAEPR